MKNEFITVALMLALSVVMGCGSGDEPEGIEVPVVQILPDAGPDSESSPLFSTSTPDPGKLVPSIKVCAKAINCAADPSQGDFQFEVAANGAPEIKGCECSLRYDNQIVYMRNSKEMDPENCKGIDYFLDLDTGRTVKVLSPPVPPVPEPDLQKQFTWNDALNTQGIESCFTVPLADMKEKAYPVISETYNAILCQRYAKEIGAMPFDLLKCQQLVQSRYIYPARYLSYKNMSLTVGIQKLDSDINYIDFTKPEVHVTFDCKNPNPVKPLAPYLN